MDLNIPGYTLLSVSGIDRPRACILARNMNTWMLPGFSCKDLLAVLINYNEGKQKDIWLLFLLICFMIPRIIP